jgi:hypothetical protein
MAVQYFEGIGRRKEATARVRLMSGSGRFIVNEKTFEEYFTRLGDIDAIMGPLAAAGHGQWRRGDGPDRRRQTRRSPCSDQHEPGLAPGNAQGRIPHP